MSLISLPKSHFNNTETLSAPYITVLIRTSWSSYLSTILFRNWTKTVSKGLLTVKYHRKNMKNTTQHLWPTQNVLPFVNPSPCAHNLSKVSQRSNRKRRTQVLQPVLPGRTQGKIVCSSRTHPEAERRSHLASHSRFSQSNSTCSQYRHCSEMLPELFKTEDSDRREYTL